MNLRSKFILDVHKERHCYSKCHFFNEKKVPLFYGIVRSFGKNSQATAKAIIESIALDDQVSTDAWNKIDTPLTDTFKI
jgi:hypothetical protein